MVYRTNIIFRTIQGDCLLYSYTYLNFLCDIVQCLLNTFIIETYFVWASIASLWLPSSHVIVIYRYYKNYGLVSVININNMTYFFVYKIFISEHNMAIVSYSPTPGQQESAILWNITITVWCLCEIFQFLLNTVIILNSYVRGQNHVLVIATVMGECAILIPKKLRFGVCRRY